MSNKAQFKIARMTGPRSIEDMAKILDTICESLKRFKQGFSNPKNREQVPHNAPDANEWAGIIGHVKHLKTLYTKAYKESKKHKTKTSSSGGFGQVCFGQRKDG